MCSLRILPTQLATHLTVKLDELHILTNTHLSGIPGVFDSQEAHTINNVGMSLDIISC